VSSGPPQAAVALSPTFQLEVRRSTMTAQALLFVRMENSLSAGHA
jgi:hypothetical protein